ncbi:MAG: hypothetical protein BWY76_00397 [bacterium ADurb.Bin429]|nr:MAG: hypothetical protein BWY76_00397 [bacterium ADurb.Bin429]
MRIPLACWLVLLLAGAVLAQAPAVQLAGVRSQKVLYGTKESIAGTVTVKNTGVEAATVTVRAWLTYDIDTMTKPQQATLTIEPGKTADAAFAWRRGLGVYGHALATEVLQDDTVLARGEDPFNVCDNFWNVALPRALGFMWQAYDAKMNPKTDPSWVQNYMKDFRGGYYNCFEHFFWAQDDFLGMVPTKDVWWSGQARYRESVVAIKTLIDTAHANGVKAITYAKLTGGGSYGMEMARRHPEWVWQNGGTLSVHRGVQSIAKWDEPLTRGLPQSWVPVNYNINDPKVVEIGIKNLCDSATFFGWDGARWDGNFNVRAETFDLNGNPVDKLTPDQIDARNAENMRLTKAYISKVHPRFRYGYNWTQGNWSQTMATTPRESIELCRDGGLIMNEYINQADSVQHPLHRWDVYAESVANDVQAIKKLGGYYGPILASQNTADGKYTNIFAYAAGAHPYYQHVWGAFVTRNSAFIWDNALTRVYNPENIIQVPASVWWRHWVFIRPIDAKCKQLIIHLINPPVKPTVGEGKKPEDVPPPLKNIEVRILPALLDGWTPTRATRLSPEPALREAVPVQAVEGVFKLTVPEVTLWNIVVIDLKKGGR